MNGRTALNGWKRMTIRTQTVGRMPAHRTHGERMGHIWPHPFLYAWPPPQSLSCLLAVPVRPEPSPGEGQSGIRIPSAASCVEVLRGRFLGMAARLAFQKGHAMF